MSALAGKHGAILVALAAVDAALYALLASAGDLRERLALYLVTHAVLAATMLAAWAVQSRTRGGSGLVIAGAIVFRAIALTSEPTLSDDVYRYVWDGRVQASGIHPFRYAPTDPALAELRDDNWSKINHPELKTIYPPAAQATFTVLALAGAGPFGFKVAMALADIGVIVILSRLLRHLRRRADLLVLYAWNPLAVMETSGSGHLEPLGTVLMLAAMLWIIEGRDKLSTIALALAAHVKLLPAVLVPAFVRRSRPLAWLVLTVALIVPVIPYAATGPAVGRGLFAYARSWEYNAFAYAGIEYLLLQCDTASALAPVVEHLQRGFGGLPLPWGMLHAMIWPRELARVSVVLLALLVVLLGSLRVGRGLVEDGLFVLGGVLLLSPTLHPWYLLWVLPLAAACRSWGWIVFSITAPLAYSGGTGDVAWTVRAAEYLPVFAAMLWTSLGPPAHPAHGADGVDVGCDGDP